MDGISQWITNIGSAVASFFQSIGENLYSALIEQDRYRFLLEGLGNTLLISLFAVLLGFVVGLLIALVKNNYRENHRGKILNKICDLYVNIIRGTPVLLQLMILYYVIFKTVDISIVLVGILAFGLNSAAYVSEIIRAGIESIDKGQMEAANALGLKYSQAMRHIILPQAIKNILPALGNEFITLIKETSVAGYIGIVELVKGGDIIAAGLYDYFLPLVMVALIYLLLTTGLSYLLKRLEKRWNLHATS